MAFNLGQFRRNNFENYVIPLKYSFVDITTQADISEAITFTDKAIALSGSNVLESNKSYYLNFEVHKELSTPQIIKVYLKNTNAIEDNIQEISTYTIEQGLTQFVVPIELIFTPNGTYNQIVFELQRISIDYIEKNEQGTHGRLLNMNIDALQNIYNVLSYIGHTPLTKIGIQGPSGLLMCINGEEIRIGKSGIYEITNGYKVNFIGFIIKPSSQTVSGTDYFVLDYQY